MCSLQGQETGINFHTFIASLEFCFSMLTTEEWGLMYDDLMIHFVGQPEFQSVGTAYVMTLMVIGQFLILNLILAAVVELPNLCF